MSLLLCFIYGLLIRPYKLALPLFIVASLSEGLFYLINQEYELNLIQSIMFGLSSIYFVKKNINISIALSCFMFIFMYFAIDARSNPDIETKFYQAFSYIITLIDLYIMYILVKKDAIRLLHNIHNSYIHYRSGVWFGVAKSCSRIHQYLRSSPSNKKSQEETKCTE